MRAVCSWKGVLLSAMVCAVAGIGCASTSSGTKMETTQVSKIERGVTTRAQIEQMFGPCGSITLMGDGRRMMLYSYHETDTHVKGTTFIPFAGAWMGGSEGTTRSQQLQVILTRADVVEDFVMNDGTTKMDYSHNPLGQTRMTSTPQAIPVATPAAGR
ncbi:MAG: hypothetical protein QOF78_1517 [Phycisphaerales bacterium]|nr:hypothetical protein [Phycisphaerales bacterium]